MRRPSMSERVLAFQPRSASVLRPPTWRGERQARGTTHGVQQIGRIARRQFIAVDDGDAGGRGARILLRQSRRDGDRRQGRGGLRHLQGQGVVLGLGAPLRQATAWQPSHGRGRKGRNRSGLRWARRGPRGIRHECKLLESKSKDPGGGGCRGQNNENNGKGRAAPDAAYGMP